MRLSEIGEFGLIRKISRWVGDAKDVIKGIGDDTAVIKYRKDKYRLLTTDMLIEGVHFKLSDATPYLIGRKALAVNISDIAAMGGVPKYAVAAFGMAPHPKISFIQAVFRGMKKLADKHGVNIVGGDTNRSNKLIINVSLIGEVEKSNLVLRSSADVGDTIFVTGRLGGSYKSKKHLKFEPRVREARFLVKNFDINSMIDISDGLANDLTRITETSHVGAIIEEKLLPVSKNCNVRDALFDGEDYELLFTTPEKETEAILKGWPYGLKLTPIGSITGAAKVIELITQRGTRRIPQKGFRHF